MRRGPSAIGLRGKFAAGELQAKRVDEPSTTPTEIDVELPVPAQGSPLDSLLAQKEVECCGNGVGALAQLFRQIVLANYYVPSWVALMDVAPVGRNPVGECTKFLCCLPLRTLASDLIGFQTPFARSCNSDKTGDHCAAFPV